MLLEQECVLKSESESQDLIHHGVLLAVFVLGRVGNFSSRFLSLYLIILFITDFLT